MHDSRAVAPDPQMISDFAAVLADLSDEIESAIDAFRKATDVLSKVGLELTRAGREYCTPRSSLDIARWPNNGYANYADT